jgi:surface antigen
LLRAALEGASRAVEVGAALQDVRWLEPDGRVHPGALLAVDAWGACVVRVDESGAAPVVASTDLPASSRAAAAAHADQADTTDPTAEDRLSHITALVADLRDAEPSPHQGAAPVAAIAAQLHPDEPPRLHFALGPPSCAVFIRHWPGLQLVPEASATPEGAPLARLAAAVAQTTATDPDLRAAARRRLDRAEAEALREGEAAEAMAWRMDADTDDRGAAVRRLVAQAHAAGLARQALEELAVPAPPGSRPGPVL